MSDTTATSTSFSDLVDQTSTALAGAPEGGATTRFTVRGSLAEGTNTQVDITAGQHRFTIDEPPALGGQDAGASPVEHLLAALASCQIITAQVWAAKLDLRLEDVTVELTGPIDLRGFLGVSDQVRPGFGDVQVNVHLSGPEPDGAYEELIRKVEEHCPVLDNLTAGVLVRTTVTAD